MFVEELTLSATCYFFEFILAPGAHSVPWINVILHRKILKKWKQPRLQNSRVLHLEIANVHDGTSWSSRRRSPALPAWVNVYRKEPSAFIYDEHSRECTMFHFGIYRHSGTRAPARSPLVDGRFRSTSIGRSGSRCATLATWARLDVEKSFVVPFSSQVLRLGSDICWC